MDLKHCQLCLDCKVAVQYDIPHTTYIVVNDEIVQIVSPTYTGRVSEIYAILRGCFVREKMKPTQVFNSNIPMYHNHETPECDTPEQAYEYDTLIQYINGSAVSAHHLSSPNQCTPCTPWKKFCKCETPDIYRLINTVVPQPRLRQGSFYLPGGNVIEDPYVMWEKYGYKKGRVPSNFINFA
jgi:hypothetical protein